MLLDATWSEALGIVVTLVSQADSDLIDMHGAIGLRSCEEIEDISTQIVGNLNQNVLAALRPFPRAGLSRARR